MPTETHQNMLHHTMTRPLVGFFQRLHQRDASLPTLPVQMHIFDRPLSYTTPLQRGNSVLFPSPNNTFSQAGIEKMDFPVQLLSYTTLPLLKSPD